MKRILFKEMAAGARVRSRFVVITIVMIASIVGMLFLGKFGVDTLSSLRAYVGGESIYSRGQQGAVVFLIQYAYTKDPRYYDEFLNQIKPALGDKKARLALEKKPPDLKMAYEGFKQGGNHPKDIDGLIDAFLTFRKVSYIDKAVGMWAQGDEKLADLVAMGQELHGMIRSNGPSTEMRTALILRLIQLNHELHDIEEAFSQSLGDASRWARGLFLGIMFGFSGICAIASLLVLWFAGRLIASMQKNTKELEAQNWLKSGQTALNEKMRGEQDIVGFSSNVIRFICEYLGAGVGAMYVCENGGATGLKMVAGYAFEKRKDLKNQLRLGEGLAGQAALEKNYIIMTDCPDDYIRINSGLGASPPKNIIAYPLIQNGQVNGVMEIGSFHEIGDRGLDYLRLAAETIAIAINATQSREKAAVLLQKTQHQAEKLAAQQEELRATNEELETQAKTLKESEQKLQAQQEELRVTNEELTEQAQALEEQKEEIERKNEELEAARREAEGKAMDLARTGKYKSEFLANMSHELRTPLNSILLLSKLLSENKDRNLTEKQVEFAQTINSSGSDLLNLINDVLDLSKVEAGKLELDLSDFTIARFAEKIQKTYEKIAEQKRLRFGIDIQPGIPRALNSDFRRVEQIVKNFISNALKFTEKGYVNLSIGRPAKDTAFCQSTLTPEKAIAFFVSDTGIGIEKQMQESIFEAFKQVDGSTSRKYGGTGLGLSISRELAKQLGGEVQLESEAGKGSIFKLFLPERFGAAEATNNECFNVSADDGEPLESKQKSIQETLNAQGAQIDAVRDDRRDISPDDKSLLIIEDDPTFARTLQDLAREKGFKTLIAGDGETGLHMTDYYRPSAIILDVMLPGIDGWNVMTRLKESSKTRHIPVHFITGVEKPGEAKKMGAVGYLTKPVGLESLNQVFEKIENLIDTRPKKLLVVECDKAEQQNIRQILDGDDIAIDTVEAGADALRHLKKDHYHCIIMGLSLSDMNGTNLLRQIREEESISHIPVIVYTAHELTDQERVFLDSHSERVITKATKSLERLFDEATLFLHRVEANLPAEKRRILEMVHDKESILKNKKVLIVDDDMRNVFALTSILENKGIHVVMAKNGREGVAQAAEDPEIDIILMDIMMPEMDGYEATRKIREMDGLKGLPIIALTAKAMRGDRTRCIEAGATDYLSKPVDADKLLSMLRVWLYR